MNKVIIVLFTIIIIVQIVHSKTFYPQDLFSYDTKNKVYYTNKDVVIASNDTLFVHKGARLSFAPFTGIELKGSLECIGTINEGIVFSSKNAITGKGSSFDWKGITLYPSSNIDLQFVTIQYSSFGIVTCCNNVHLNSVVFQKNGKSNNLKIGDRSIVTPDNTLFSYGKYLVQSSSYNAIKENTQQVKEFLIPPMNYLYIPASVAFITGGLLFLSRSIKTHTIYQNYRPGNEDYDVGTGTIRRQEYEKLRKRYTTDVSLAAALGSCGIALGVYSFYYTITF